MVTEDPWQIGECRISVDLLPITVVSITIIPIYALGNFDRYIS